MLGPFIEDWILGYMYGSLVSHFNGIERIDGTVGSSNNLVSHTSSAQTLLIDLYSASAEYKAIVCCFFDYEDKRVLPSKIKNPLTDFLVSGHAAQSES